MNGSLQSLKHLESLVKQSCEALNRVFGENRALKERLARLEGEHRRMKEDLREAALIRTRHERLKARLLKLSEKLERVT